MCDVDECIHPRVTYIMWCTYTSGVLSHWDEVRCLGIRWLPTLVGVYVLRRDVSYVLLQLVVHEGTSCTPLLHRGMVSCPTHSQHHANELLVLHDVPPPVTNTTPCPMGSRAVHVDHVIR